jgi:putative membrane protein
VQFFERFGGFEGVADAARPAAPRYIGLVLIAAGVLVLVVSAWQYHVALRYLWYEFEPIRGFGKAPRHTPVYAIAIGMIFVGVFAFLVVLTRAL